MRYDEREKRDLLAKLEELFQVAGAGTPFVELGLDKLNRRELRAVEYRVRQSIADAYAQGEKSHEGNPGPDVVPAGVRRARR